MFLHIFIFLKFYISIGEMRAGVKDLWWTAGVSERVFLLVSSLKALHGTDPSRRSLALLYLFSTHNPLRGLTAHAPRGQ